MPTLFIGSNTIRLPIVESTNTYAQDLLKNTTIPEGTLIITEEQTLGRGQRGNTWQSEPGKNLTFSLILNPPLVITENQFLLTQIISLSLLEFIEKEIGATKKVSIKWPNDIFVEDKKIAGILIENLWRANKISSSIVGIGVNVNQHSFEIESATSLKNACQKEFNLEECLNKLCSYIEARYLQLKHKNLALLRTEYHNKLYHLYEYATYQIEDRQVVAKIIGVNPNGKLLLEMKSDFSVLELDIKEVKFIL